MQPAARGARLLSPVDLTDPRIAGYPSLLQAGGIV